MHKHRHWPQHTKLESKVLCDSEGPRKTTAEIMKQNENHTHTHTQAFIEERKEEKETKAARSLNVATAKKRPSGTFQK